MKKNKNQYNREVFFVGSRIRSSKVLCIDHENANLGVLSIQEALEKAKAAGLDLVQISMKKEMPICKILDFSKFKYNKSKKEKEIKKKQRVNVSKTKEIKFRPSTSENDLKIKAKKTQEFINDGHKVKVFVSFKGREISYKSIAQEKLDVFLNMLIDVVIDAEPVLLGKQLTVSLSKQTTDKKQVSK